MEIVKESFSLSPLSRLSCYEGNGLYKGSGCKLRSYEILGYRKTWNVRKGGGRDLRGTLIPSEGLGRDVRTVTRRKSVLKKYAQILTVELAVDLGSVLRWGKAIVPFFFCDQ